MSQEWPLRGVVPGAFAQGQSGNQEAASPGATAEDQAEGHHCMHLAADVLTASLLTGGLCLGSKPIDSSNHAILPPPAGAPHSCGRVPQSTNE